MNIIDIIATKRDKKELSKEEIEFFVQEYTNGNITDYQAAAFIMSVYLNGMNEKETTYLTMAMANSGEILDLSVLSENIVDKHSTGGVGDKITLILMPIIASLGIPVAKMSGRGLGFTGGTIDKLESIPGYKTNIEMTEFIANVNNVGISLIGQTLNLAPADKKIYALRDAIGCVDNMSLIASSIMSKKIAAGAKNIVLDVTVGSGAFMKSKETAVELAKIMNKIGKLAKRKTICVLTDMDEPLGKTIGNNLELIETVECLKGNMPEDIKEVVITLGAYMLKLAGLKDNLEENKKKILQNIENGKAYKKFIELVKSQEGDISYIENPKRFKKAKFILPVAASKEGYVTKLNAQEVGEISVELGAGRKTKEDEIDHAVGIVLNKKVGDKVEQGDVLAYIHANNEELGIRAAEDLKLAYKIMTKRPKKKDYILGIVE